MIYHSGPRHQKGRGLGSIFAALFRGLAPIAKLGLRAGRSILSSPLARKVGQTALDVAKKSAVNIAADIIDPTASSQQTAKRELEDARQKIATTLRGGAKRKKTSPVRSKTAKNKRGGKKSKRRGVKKSSVFKHDRGFSLLD